MKITKIKKLCVEACMCMIYDTNESRQWIGTQDAIYPVDGLKIDEQNVKVKACQGSGGRSVGSGRART